MADSAMNVMSLFAELGLKADSFNGGLAQSEKNFKGFENLVTGLAATATATFAIIGAAAAGAGLMVLKSASDIGSEYNAQMAIIEARTGLAGEALEEFGVISRTIFKTGVGNDLADVGTALSMVKQQIDDVYSDQFESITSGALKLRDTFNVDLREGIDAVSMLMSDMGLSSTEAMDFIVTGFQRGLNSNDDFIDSIREYSPQFASAGFDAAQFFSIMETGLAGASLGTDKVSDAVKEMQIRFDAGDKTIKEGLTSMGYSWDEMHNSVLSGQTEVADYFPVMIGRLVEMRDRGEDWKSTMFNVFGTQSEDLQQLVLQLDAGKTSMDDIAGAAVSMEAQYNTLPALWEQISRSFQDSLIPLGQSLLQSANAAMPLVRTAFGIFETEILPMFMTGISWLNANVMPWLLDFGSRASVIFTEFSATFGEAWSEMSTVLATAFDRMDEAFGGTLSNIDWMDVAIMGLTIALDAIVVGIESVSAVVSFLSEGLRIATDMMRPFIDAWNSLEGAATRATSAIPEWMIPHSPPPFAEGLALMASSMESLNEEFANIPVSGLESFKRNFTDLNREILDREQQNSSNVSNVTNDSSQRVLQVNRYGGNEVQMQDLQTLSTLV